MKLIAAYMMAVLGGDESPAPAKIQSILESVGIEGGEEDIKKLCTELNGKNIDDLINIGRSKIGSTVVASSSVAKSESQEEKPKEDAKEEKKEEKEESEQEVGFNLFGDDDD